MPDQPANSANCHRTGAFYEYDPSTEEFHWSAAGTAGGPLLPHDRKIFLIPNRSAGRIA